MVPDCVFGTLDGVSSLAPTSCFPDCSESLAWRCRRGSFHCENNFEPMIASAAEEHNNNDNGDGGRIFSVDKGAAAPVVVALRLEACGGRRLGRQ